MSLLAILLLPNPTVRRASRAFALLLFAAILVAGSVPGARAGVGEYASGIVLHSLAYAFLATLWFLASGGTPVQRALKAMLAVAAMGAVDEGVQSFLPYRSGDVRDWMIDVTAATVAATVLAVLATLAPRAATTRSNGTRRR